MRDIWIAYGQSNCTGKTVDPAEADRFAELPVDVQFQMWGDNLAQRLTPTWLELRRETQREYYPFCSALEVVRDLRAAGHHPVLLKYARNGCPLATVLRPTAGDWWGTACAWWVEQILKLSSPYLVRGFIWVGCEGDAAVPDRVAQIPEGLEEIETYLLAALSAASIRVHPDGLLWVLQTLHPEMDRKFLADANAKYVEFCAAAPTRRVYADITGLENVLLDQGDPGPTDDIHYSPAAYHGAGGVGDTVSAAVLGAIE